MAENKPLIPTTLAPWLTVFQAVKAIDFYKQAFGAQETYRLELSEEELVVRLSIQGAEFWISSAAPQKEEAITTILGGETIRLILTVADPDTLFDQALQAGATLIFPISEEHGWRLGRVADPFGLHWEIGYPLLP